jgi:hypothetical protein
MKFRKSDHITFVGSAVVVFLCTNAVAQEGHYGLGHDKWHESFYSTLKRDDGGSCCNLMDCRPTQSRTVHFGGRSPKQGERNPDFLCERALKRLRAIVKRSPLHLA